MGRRYVVTALWAAMALCASQGAQAVPVVMSLTEGVWRNPKDTVHVAIRACGGGECGHVVWASEDAIADARKGGTANLIGLQLFRDFVRQDDGAWRGKVFVPDLNITLTGTAEPIDANTLRARGCVLAHILCKSQIWTRIETPSG